MKKGFQFIKKRKFLSATIAIVLLGILYFTLRGSGSPAVNVVTVRRGTIEQIVSVTGKTKPVTDVDLSFQTSGRISSAPARIGQHVSPGELLAQLDVTELLAQLAEANARVAAEQAKLDELKLGSRPEDIRVAETQLKKAQQDLANDYESVPDVLNDAYIKADDAVRKQLDGLFTNPDESNPHLTFTVNDNQKQIDAENKRVASGIELKTWKKELDALAAESSPSNLLIDQNLQNAKAHLFLIRDLMNKAMDTVVASVTLNPTTITTYKTNITTGRTNVALALTNVNTQIQTIASQKITVAELQDQLDLKRAGSTPGSISSQSAVVKQAQASAQVIQAQIAKSVIRSPIAGTVTRQDAKAGENAPLNTTLISVIASGKLEIEANIPEADIAKVKIDNSVGITFDAFGDSAKFSGHVVFIDPAETIIDGVPTYKTTIELGEENQAIKPGLTANLDILTDERENALIIPQRSITYRGETKVVLIPRKDNPTEERQISTGLRGSDGNIEVVEGLSVGEEIVASPQ